MRARRKVVESWNRRARAYDELTRRCAVFARMAGRLAAELPAGFRGGLLDIGAGSGLVAEAVLNRFPTARAVLLEPAEGMRRLADRRLAGRPAAVLPWEAEEADKAGGPFDAALSSASLHLADEARFMPAVGRALRPGGLFAFNLWDHSWAEARKGDLHAGWREGMAKAFREADLQVPDWDDLPAMRPKTRRGLLAAAESGGLVLEKEESDRDSEPGSFWIDFLSMSPNWPKRNLAGNKRVALLRRARRLMPARADLPSTRLLFRKRRTPPSAARR